MDTHGIWRSAAMTMSGIIVTGVVSWFSFGAGHPTNEQVERLLESGGPYNRDKALIMDAIVSQRAQGASISGQVQALAIEQSKVSAKLDQLVTEVQQFRTDRRADKHAKDMP